MNIKLDIYTSNEQPVDGSKILFWLTNQSFATCMFGKYSKQGNFIEYISTSGMPVIVGFSSVSFWGDLPRLTDIRIGND